MTNVTLPEDLKDFLGLLEDEQVRYLLIGGYAVSYYGHPGILEDLNIWIAVSPENASRIVNVLKRFGMEIPELALEMFLDDRRTFRLGAPPMRVTIHTGIDGVEFEACYASRLRAILDGVPVSIIGLEDLKASKRACGRYSDLEDLKSLP